MNKNGKAGIAIGAGVLLLLGGGGTLAVWNAQTTVSGGTVYAGTLEIGTVPDGVWYLASQDGTTPTTGSEGLYDTTAWTVIDPTTYAVVPGDVLVYQVEDIPLTFAGGDLFFYYSLGDFGGTADGYTVGDVVSATEDAPAGLTTAPAGTYAPSPGAATVYEYQGGTTANATANVTAQVAIQFGDPSDTAPDTGANLDTYSTLSLEDATFSVNQVVPAS